MVGIELIYIHNLLSGVPYWSGNDLKTKTRKEDK